LIKSAKAAFADIRRCPGIEPFTAETRVRFP
jgi:hypothetical protein